MPELRSCDARSAGQIGATTRKDSNFLIYEQSDLEKLLLGLVIRVLLRAPPFLLRAPIFLLRAPLKTYQ